MQTRTNVITSTLLFALSCVFAYSQFNQNLSTLTQIALLILVIVLGVGFFVYFFMERKQKPALMHWVLVTLFVLVGGYGITSTMIRHYQELDVPRAAYRGFGDIEYGIARLLVLLGLVALYLVVGRKGTEQRQGLSIRLVAGVASALLFVYVMLQLAIF